MASRELRRVSGSEIRLNEPLKFSIYDEHGTLLLRKGIIVTIPAQIERLLKTGIYEDNSERDEREDRESSREDNRTPTYVRAEDICSKLKSLYVQIFRMPDQIDVQERTSAIAQMIQDACECDFTGVVAALHVDAHIHYLALHQVLGAVLVELVAKLEGMPPAARISLICAALTRDIGQARFHADLDKVSGPLTDEMKALVHNHPAGSAEILKSAGVKDPIWLSAVEEHHERIDGSGYNKGLSSPQISSGGKLLAICDSYSAMVKPRPYRRNGQAKFTQSALRDLFTQGGKSVDQSFAALLVKAIGIIPPGTIVQLKCGEIAIAKDRISNPADAIVYTLYDKNQMPTVEPLQRNTSNPEHEITGMIPHSECRSAQLIIKSIWSKG
jgi:HD-GYP domain-containing protein (c-di-GMP phosphodiesterase class II)